jgi:hypothetical protein
MKASSETRYFVTEAVSVPVMLMRKKGEAYRMVTGPGWGLLEWFSAINNYTSPVVYDRTDKTMQLICDAESSAVIYAYGREYVIGPCERVVLSSLPRQADIDAIILNDPCGFSFWEKENGLVKIFVIYDENGLIDTYRLDNWTGKPYDGETEISFSDLQSQYEYDHTSRAEITGTFEYEKKLNEAAA